MHQNDIERFAFLYLCGRKDRDLLSGRKKMTFQNFERLVYITDCLGMDRMKLEIWNRFSSQFKEQFDVLEKLSEENWINTEFREFDDEIQIHDRWLADFCSAAPDNEVREFLSNIFDMRKLDF